MIIYILYYILLYIYAHTMATIFPFNPDIHISTNILGTIRWAPETPSSLLQELRGSRRGLGTSVGKSLKGTADMPWKSHAIYIILIYVKYIDMYIFIVGTKILRFF